MTDRRRMASAGALAGALVGALAALPLAAHAADGSLTEAGDPAGLWSILLVGILGLAIGAVVGTAWARSGQRRLDDDDGPIPGLAPASPRVERRALRRAQLSDGDDPILSALGLSDQPDRGPDAAARTGRRDSARPRSRPTNRY